MPGDGSPLTNPLFFVLAAVGCIAAGLVFGWGIWMVLEPYDLSYYQWTSILSVIFVGAGIIGITPYVVPWFLREYGFLEEEEEGE
jgi:hypothetical protein